MDCVVFCFSDLYRMICANNFRTLMPVTVFVRKIVKENLFATKYRRTTTKWDQYRARKNENKFIYLYEILKFYQSMVFIGVGFAFILLIYM